VVAWGQGEWVEQLQSVTGPLDIVFRPNINEYNGYRKVEMQLVDWRHSQLAPQGPHWPQAKADELRKEDADLSL
jgi:hypothetical protein